MNPREQAALWMLVGAMVVVGMTLALQPPLDARDATRATGFRIDINTADEPTLRLLPRIGSALAQRIIDQRRRTGAFAAVAELDAIKGIGPATVRQVEPYVTVPGR